MKGTVFITILITGLTCCVILLVQASKNRSLRDGVVEERESVEELKRELQQIDPLTGLDGARRPLPGAPQELAMAENDTTGSLLSESSAARVERTRDSIDRLVLDLDDIDSSPAEFFKVLPDILRIIQDLSIEEMIAVAQGIDAPDGMSRPTGKGIARMVLLMLAAEDDPVRVIQDGELMKDREMRQSLLSQLARRDPKAAREWVKNSDLTKGEKEEFESFLTFNVMRNDVGAGLQLLREMKGKGGDRNRAYSRVSEMPVPVEVLPDLVQAYKNPSNADMREEISGIVLRTHVMNGGVAATREAAGELEMTPQELSNFFLRDFRGAISAQPQAAMDWMTEELDEEWQQRTLPIVISNWAGSDFNAAGEYLGKMEASKTKDMAIKQFAGTVSQVDPEAAAVWSLEIGDEDLRKEALTNVTNRWRAKDQEAVKQWMEENGVTE